ncbi:helix-turn-helix domain-containing protein [Streptomyces mirabilis]|uniref:helix-turn-helix domain-containing protein n=1 Tax=Streptomyces mirabilis TaxID=68239 RepID=UPI003662B61C
MIRTTDLCSVMSLGADDVWSSRYAGCVRYPQGGGLTPERQAFRERIRLEAAERFAAGASSAEVARDLRVGVRSVQRWRRAWCNAGTEGLRSAGPVSRPKLSEALFTVLEQELAGRRCVRTRPSTAEHIGGPVQSTTLR